LVACAKKNLATLIVVAGETGAMKFKLPFFLSICHIFVSQLFSAKFAADIIVV
jgi:hypothetical protein